MLLLQKKAIRAIARVNRRTSCRPYFVSLNILTLPCIFLLETVCMIHKQFSSDIWTSSVVATRSSHTLNLPIPSSTLVKNSIVYTSKKKFNHLPLSLRQIRSGTKFRRKIKQLLLPKAFYSVEEYFSCSFD